MNLFKSWYYFYYNTSFISSMTTCLCTAACAVAPVHRHVMVKYWNWRRKFKWLQLDSNLQTGQIIELCCEYLSVRLTVCSYHVTYAFQSKSTLHSCLNVKELLARSRGKIWSLSDCNWTRTHNHLVRKRTLSHLAKLAKWLVSLTPSVSRG